MGAGTAWQRVKPVSPYQFAAFRIVLGAYLAVHCASLIPYGRELFGADGILPDAGVNFTHGILPNPLAWSNAPWAPALLLSALTLLAVAFACGFYRQITACLLWFGWACLFNRNNLISNPSIPYVGLLLLLCAAIPPGEPWSLKPRCNLERWFFPAWVFRAAWIAMAVGYTFSGLDKLIQSPSWLDGSAFSHVLRLPLARPGPLRDALLLLPDGALMLLTWSALLLEVAFLPLSLHRKTRPWAWLAMVGMHLGVLVTVAFADLVAGMLLLHFFTFDPEWLPRGKQASIAALVPTGNLDSGRLVPEFPIVFFDGACGMCTTFVRGLMRADSKGVFRFAPLEGETARRYLPPLHPDPRKRSLVCLDEGRIHEGAEALLQISARLGGAWPLLGIGRLVPRTLRALLYRLIASNRYAGLGRSKRCQIPSADERRRLLS